MTRDAEDLVQRALGLIDAWRKQIPEDESKAQELRSRIQEGWEHIRARSGGK